MAAMVAAGRRLRNHPGGVEPDSRREQLLVGEQAEEEELEAAVAGGLHVGRRESRVCRPKGTQGDIPACGTEHVIRVHLYMYNVALVPP